MDFLDIRALEVGRMALDGLSKRHKLISANIANAGTEGYKRVDVSFESQISKIIQKEEIKDHIKLENSEREMNGLQLSDSLKSNLAGLSNDGGLDAEKLKENNYKLFNPKVYTDNSEGMAMNKNNVSIEREMAELSKNAMKYNVIAEIQKRIYTELKEVIKKG